MEAATSTLPTGTVKDGFYLLRISASKFVAIPAIIYFSSFCDVFVLFNLVIIIVISSFQYCTQNKSPNTAECPAPPEGCRFAGWFAKSNWCHLAGLNCQPVDATKATPSLFVRAGCELNFGQQRRTIT